MKLKIKILSVIFLWGIQLIAQNNIAIDSLINLLDDNIHDTTRVNIYMELSSQLTRSLPDSAVYYINEGISLANKRNLKSQEAKFYARLGNIDWNRGRLDEAREEFNIAISIYDKLSSSADQNDLSKIKTALANCYNGLGIVCFLRADYTGAINYFQLSLTKHEEIKNKKGMANTYNNIGLIHWKQENLNRAVEYFFKSLNISKELGNDREAAACLNNIAIIYKNQKKYDESLNYYNESLEILLNIDDKQGVARCYNNISMLNEEQGNYELALEFCQKALALREEIGDKTGIASSLGNLASINNKFASQSDNNSIRRNRYNIAINCAKRGLSIAKEIEAINKELEIYEILYTSYKGLKKFDESLLYLKKHEELKDSIFSKEKNKQIEEAEAKFQTLHKQQEIDKQDAQLEKQKTTRKYLSIFIIIILVLIILLYNRFKIKRRVHKILEEKNKELQKLSAVARETDNSITIFDAQGNIEWINEAFSNLLGYNFEEFKKKVGNTIFNASTNPNIEEIFNKVIHDKKTVHYESRIASVQGIKYIMQTTITPILNDQNEIVKLISIDSDISELKKAESEIIQKNEEILAQKEEIENHKNHLEKIVEQRTIDLQIAIEKAKESDRLKSSFLTNMSHEIRTPMNAIIGFSDMLNDNNLDTDTKNELIREISTNSYSLLNLIDNILELARLDTNQFKIKKINFDPSITLREIFFSYYDIVQLKGLKFELNIPEKKTELFSDHYRITQIFKNLMDNAIKFTDKGKIEIGFQIVKNSLEFFVKDTGIGLSADLQNLIFERFTKIEDNKRKLYRGAGLGLAICRNIVNLLNGNIWVESEPNKGAAFYFTIPYQGELSKADKSKVTKKDADESVKFSNQIILIAEDEESNFQYLKMLLRHTELKLLRAENGKEAIDICNNTALDLVLMDIKMPIIDGLEATKKIKKEKPNLPVISLSAYSSKEDIELSKKAGCEEHLSKPIQKTRLFEAIQKYLNKRD